MSVLVEFLSDFRIRRRRKTTRNAVRSTDGAAWSDFYDSHEWEPSVEAPRTQRSAAKSFRRRMRLGAHGGLKVTQDVLAPYQVHHPADEVIEWM